MPDSAWAIGNLAELAGQLGNIMVPEQIGYPVNIGYMQNRVLPWDTDQPMIYMSRFALLGGVATCSEGFVICFLKVPLVCLGSMAAAVQPNGLGNFQKTVYKTFGTSSRPTQYCPHKHYFLQM